jgi:hypothetical protein
VFCRNRNKLEEEGRLLSDNQHFQPDSRVPDDGKTDDMYTRTDDKCTKTDDMYTRTDDKCTKTDDMCTRANDKFTDSKDMHTKSDDIYTENCAIYLNHHDKESLDHVNRQANGSGTHVAVSATNPKSTNSSDSGSVKKSNPIFDFSLLKNIRFMLFCTALLMFQIAFNSAFIFLPPMATDRGLTVMEAAYIISIAGVLDMFGRISSGIFLDLKRVKPFRPIIYNVVMLLVALLSFLAPYMSSVVDFCVYCAMYGWLSGTYVSQKSVVMVDFLGSSEKLSSGFGILIWFQGMGTLIGPPMSGEYLG